MYLSSTFKYVLETDRLYFPLCFSLSKSDKSLGYIIKATVHEMTNDKLLICIYIKQMTATVHTKSWLIFQPRLILTPREVYFPRDRKPGLLTTRRPFHIFTGSDLYLNLKLSIPLANRGCDNTYFLDASRIRFAILGWFPAYTYGYVGNILVSYILIWIS